MVRLGHYHRMTEVFILYVGEFSIWSDSFVANGVAVLVCVAQGGYHPSVTYEWKKSECVVCRHPVTYEQVSGSYMCEVQGKDVYATRIFHVEGMMSTSQNKVM